MNGQVVPLGSDVHLKVQSLLPWYVGATLDAPEREGVEAHLADCPRCRAELAVERALQAAYAATAETIDRGTSDPVTAATLAQAELDLVTLTNSKRKAAGQDTSADK